MHKVYFLFYFPVWVLLRYLKSKKVLSKVRVLLYRALKAKISDDVLIQHDVQINGAKNFSMGSKSFIGEGCKFYSYDESICIGQHVLIATGCVFLTRNHIFSDLNVPISLQGYDNQPIQVGDNVWFGANCIILPGSVIESGCVIAANSVIRGTLKQNSVYGGIPAKYIKSR